MLANYTVLSKSFNTLELIDAGEEQKPVPLFNVPRQRFHYVVHFIYQGTGMFTVQNIKTKMEMRLSAGTIFAIYKNDSVLYQSFPDDPFHYFWFSFDGEEAEKIMEYIGFSRTQPILHLQNPDKIFHVWHTLLKNTCGESRYVSLYEVLKLIETLRQNVVSTKKDVLSKTQNEIFLRAENYINENINNNIRVSDLVAHLNIDRSHFSKIFKKQFGVPPQVYIRNLKLRKAEYLLRYTSYSITTIAESLGFPDIYCFSKLFKKQYRTSPFQFRKMLNQNKKY
ncbi:MAG: AraC family transcriptional regulator [Candidatus Scatosoma sp.]